MQSFTPAQIVVSLLTMVTNLQVEARDQICIVGSADSLTATRTIAEQISQHWDRRPPSLLVTDSGNGFN